MTITVDGDIGTPCHVVSVVLLHLISVIQLLSNIVWNLCLKQRPNKCIRHIFKLLCVCVCLQC